VERFMNLARSGNVLLLAPVFSRLDRYQLLGIGGRVRSDLRLLQLVEEVMEKCGLEPSRFDLFGYSGGGQFAHRFLYFHPDRLRAVAIGAPGTVTLPSDRYPWPTGVARVAERAGLSLSLDALKPIKILLVVGGRDVTQRDLNQSRRAIQTGANRLER